MTLIACKWIGAVADSSGYSSATRSYINALIDTGQIDLSVGVVSFEQKKTSHGKPFDRIVPFIDRKINYQIQVTHVTPDLYPAMKDQKAYNIGYTVWEADRLPDFWVPYCNQMDEIWVPSQWNKEIFIKSGVNKPIYVVPHVLTLPDMSDAQSVSMGIDEDAYMFYSIFQWTSRKNPRGLLKAYLTEFKPDEKVCLALKTYRLNTSVKEQQAIKDEIKAIKQSLALKDYPQLRFFGTLLPVEYMKGFHKRGDCFVLPHRGEGFGIPHAEAMSFGKPVISTNYSGNLEFMNEQNSFLINCQETPVFGMIFPNYFGYMTWAEPDIMHLRKLMRICFEDRTLAKQKGEQAKKDVIANLSSEHIGQIMVNRFKEISEKLS